MEQDMGDLESWCLDKESVQTLLNAGHQYGSCVAPCLLSCHSLLLPAASFQLQAVLSVPKNLSWCVCFTSFISCPPLTDFLSFTHCFQALFSSTWSLFLKTRNLLFTDHMLSAIICKFWECSQQGNSGTGVMDSQEMSLPPIPVHALAKGEHQYLSWRKEASKERGRMNSLHKLWSW